MNINYKNQKNLSFGPLLCLPSIYQFTISLNNLLLLFDKHSVLLLLQNIWLMLVGIVVPNYRELYIYQNFYKINCIGMVEAIKSLRKSRLDNLFDYE